MTYPVDTEPPSKGCQPQPERKASLINTARIELLKEIPRIQDQRFQCQYLLMLQVPFSQSPASNTDSILHCLLQNKHPKSSQFYTDVLIQYTIHQGLRYHHGDLKKNSNNNQTQLWVDLLLLTGHSFCIIQKIICSALYDPRKWQSTLELNF